MTSLLCLVVGAMEDPLRVCQRLPAIIVSAHQLTAQIEFNDQRSGLMRLTFLRIWRGTEARVSSKRYCKSAVRDAHGWLKRLL